MGRIIRLPSQKHIFQKISKVLSPRQDLIDIWGRILAEKLANARLYPIGIINCIIEISNDCVHEYSSHGKRHISAYRTFSHIPDILNALITNPKSKESVLKRFDEIRDGARLARPAKRPE